MAGAWHDFSPAVRGLMDVAGEHTGIPVPRLLHGAGLALRDTRAYQPTLVAICAGALQELESRIGPAAYVAGHSLGELPALVAAGGIAADDVVPLAAVRARLMAREAALHPGGMVALRTDETGAREAVAIASAAGAASIAAHNAPDEQVLSGDLDAMRTVPARFSPTPLATDGAWHSAAMAGAVEEFRAAVGRACKGIERAAWLPNRTGAVASPDADVATLLAEQLTHPVHWSRTLATLHALGARTLVTIGPSKALRALARRTLGDPVTVIAIEHPRDLLRAEEALAA